MQKKISFESLSGSREFKEVLSGKKLNSDLFTIFYKLKNFNDKKNTIQLSCVAAKKLGNAVKRNKMRRRLKMAVRKAIIEIEKKFKKEFKYAIFAKSKIYNENYQNIVNELATKLKLI